MTATPTPRPQPSPASDLAPGARIGPWTLTALLGRGGTGEVWEATGGEGGEPVALKLPRRPSYVRCLRREGLYLAEVRHPNVARFIAADLDAPAPWLALELVRGKPLRAFCDGEMSPSKALLLLDQVLRGLEAIHAAGILHLDLKPENVIVDGRGVAKIVDLGLGRASTRVMREAYLSVSLASREMPIAGTLAYMAPEQRRGQDVDARTDLFAFGVLVHELLAGTLPEPSRRLHERRPEVTPRWHALVSKLTHPIPERRPASALETRRLLSFTLAEKLVVPVAARGTGRSVGTSAFDETTLDLASPYSPGDSVGGCALEALLGRGGSGEVWRARREGAPVAMKLALREGDGPALAREAALMERVQDPAIPRLVADESGADPPRLILELIEGESLRGRLHEEGRLGVEPAALLARAMADAVAACHAAGVVHGDLKPEHFIVRPPEAPARARVRLIDFGLAREATSAGRLAATLASGLAPAGTFDYLAPEQRDGAEADEACDVYALGVCFFEMLTGALPRGPQRVGALRPGVPAEVEALVHGMLHPEPARRPAMARVARTLGAARLSPAARRARSERSLWYRFQRFFHGSTMGTAPDALLRLAALLLMLLAVGGFRWVRSCGVDAPPATPIRVFEASSSSSSRAEGLRRLEERMRATPGYPREASFASIPDREVRELAWEQAVSDWWTARGSSLDQAIAERSR